MAPSGAGLSPVGCLLLWLLAVARWVRAEANASAPADNGCISIDNNIAAVLNSSIPQRNVTLGLGCHILTHNFVCTPIRNSILITGAGANASSWDTDFDLYQFSVEPGVEVTLRDLVLERALVFTAVDTDLQPTTRDARPALQPAIFHMRAGSRLVMQNVTLQTRCSTLTYFWNRVPGFQLSSAQPLPPLMFGNATLGAVTLLNVTVRCEQGLEPSSPVNLYVHNALMLRAFIAATRALSVSTTIHIMENVTLPYAPSPYGTEPADQRDGLVTADTAIVGTGPGKVTYVDANFTEAWLAVQSPARLTLRQLVLTRLNPTIVTPGGSNGLLAGALPLPMVQVTGSSAQPTRYFEDVTLVVPQYEVTEMTYWCIMVSVGTPEVKAVANFLRPYVWPNDFEVLDSARLYLKRIRTVSSMYIRVMLTSQPPAGVPFEDSEPPLTVASYQHVQPPLYIVTTGHDWADAVAPVLPQDTWSSPPPSGGPAAAAASAAAGSGGGSSPSLPALVLLNGTVALRPLDVQVSRGGGTRVVRRSVVVASMRQGCGDASDAPCPLPVLDLGGLTDVMRLSGPNTTVVFMGITLRNVSSVLIEQALGASNADLGSIGGFFIFDRSTIQMSFESVTVELKPSAFAILRRVASLSPRGGSAGDLSVISVSDTLIQLASFQFGGVRGSFVNFTNAGGWQSDAIAQSAAPDGGGSATRGAVPVIAGSIVGGSCALLLTVGIGTWLVRARRRRAESGDLPAVAEGSADGKRRDCRGASKSAAADLSLEGSGASTCNVFGSPHHVGAGDSGGAAAAVEAATAAAAVAEAGACADRAGPCSGGEGSPQCTTCTVSDLNSSETATPPLMGVPQMAAALPVPALPLALAATSLQMPRQIFSLARSVPEEDEAGAGASIDSSVRGDGGSACSTSAGGVGPRLLLDAPASGDAAAAATAASAGGVGTLCGSRVLPSLLDPTVDASGRGSVWSGGGGSGASARRMVRTPSGGRSHLYGMGETGRLSGLRVRAAIGRSPSRPARSATSSSSGPSAALPAPQPAVLVAPPSPSMTAPPSITTASVASGSSIRYHAQSHHLRPQHCESQRREGSTPTLVAGVSGCGELGEGTASHSTLTAMGGTLDPLLGQTLDADSISPGLSTSMSKIPEPASEVQRLIQELSTHGTDQLVILEPIGQGGYGMVYRGVWRNLDVAVKTVLFQDRANLTQPQLCCSLSACNPSNGQTQTSVIQEDEEGGQKVGPCSQSGSILLPSHTSPPIGSLAPTSGASVNCGGTPAAAGLGAAPAGGSRDVHASGGGGGGSIHNWAVASQQAGNSGSLPSVNVGGAGGGGAAAAGGPLGVASQQRAVLEAAVSCSVTHPNVVATYHYDITPIRPSGVVCSGGLLVSDGSYLRAAAAAAAGGGGGLLPVGLGGPGATVISDWKLYLVQEFCDAGSLANALDARAFHDPAGMPNLALTLCALGDIARGMAHIHSRSIVHGDLNPTNILLRSVSGSNGGIVPMWNRVAMAGGSTAAAGGGGGSGSTTPGGSISAAAQLRHELGVTLVAKVADFGLCGMLAPGKRHISNALRGTPFYTAPETVATGTLTKASDVYSFGVIAWEVYTGRPPFQHVPDQGFVRDESFPRLPPHVPATFANMALACVNSDPDARPTFDQILDRLMSLQSKLAVSLQQRLSRLMGGGGALLGAASLLGPGTAASTPHGAATPTTTTTTTTTPTAAGPRAGGGGQSASMSLQAVYCGTGSMGLGVRGMGWGLGMGLGVATAGFPAGEGVGSGSPGLVGVAGGVPNYPLSTPCVLQAAASQTVAAAEWGGGR